MVGRGLPIQSCETDWDSGCHREWEKAVGKNARKNILTHKRKPHYALEGLVTAQTISILAQCCPLIVYRQCHRDYPWLHSHQDNIRTSCVLWVASPLITILNRYFMLGLRRDNIHRYLAMPFSTAYGAMQLAEEERKQVEN